MAKTPKRVGKSASSATKKDAPKRKVSYAGSRVKGRAAEAEFVNILRAEEVPSMRVIASGSYIGAKGDVKVAVTLNSDGSYPAADEAQCMMRVEVKNRADNPTYLHTAKNGGQVLALIDCTRDGPEALWKYLNQDKVTKAVVLRRSKVPPGALKNKDYNEIGMVCMGYGDFIQLLKQAIGNVDKRSDAEAEAGSATPSWKRRTVRRYKADS